MKIRFILGWSGGRSAGGRDFSSDGALALFSDYFSRVRRFTPCEAAGRAALAGPRPSASRLWLCDRAPGSKTLSSEDVAARLERMLTDGVRSWDVAIGGPDGFSDGERRALAPDVRWSFGPLTLPHELAVAVAAEQVYRAWTIVRKHPYHVGH